MKALAIIPARFQSSRFPGKPLAPIAGKPMLQHVYDNVVSSGLFQQVIIATDDSRIMEAAQSWDASCMLTDNHHPSGTDRCAEVVRNLPESFDVVVNIQGDEPFIDKKPLEQLLNIFETDPDAGIATLVQKIEDPADIWDENTAKVVLEKELRITNYELKRQLRITNYELRSESPATNNQQPTTISKALYFSRSPIPFIRSIDKNDWLDYHIFLKHIGLYAYKPEILEKIVKLPVSLLEKAESLEQLRWLENGYEIYAAETDYKMLSVDTPEDLERAENFFINNRRF